MKKILSKILFVLVVFASNAQAHMQHSTDEATALLQEIRKGGYILYFRHERTNMSILDQKNFDTNDCSTQRNLSYSGVASAHEIGTHISALNIPIGKVVSSPLCRTKETARYLFNHYVIDERLYGGGKSNEVKHDLLKIMQELDVRNKNAAVVAHLGNFYRLFGVRLQEGDAAIVKIVDGQAKHIGTLRSNQWNDFIIDNQFAHKN